MFASSAVDDGAGFADEPANCVLPPDPFAGIEADDGDLRALDGMAPGPFLGVVLSGIDVDHLVGHDRIAVLRAHYRQASHHLAQAYRAMVAVVDAVADADDHGEDFPEEAAAAEIGCALTLTRRSADVELSLALDLHRRLPAVWQALAAGQIDVRRARALIDGTNHLPMAHAREVVAGVIDEASELTTGQLYATLRKRCIESHPDETAVRYRRGVDDRRVVMEPATDGTATLYASGLPPHRISAGLRRINRLAQSMSGPGEPRSMDQLRADVFLDLLTGSGPAGAQPNAARGMVDIRVGLSTLAGLDDHPGELLGFGPVIAEVARDAVAAQHDAEWRTTVTDSNGAVVTAATTRYRPTADQRRKIEATYPTCVWPGCRMPSRQGDLDHTTPHSAGGPTEVANLAPLCRHHHVIRHRWRWRYRRLRNGDHRFISPLGRTYTTRAPPA